jgi:serine/threonine protein kinase
MSPASLIGREIGSYRIVAPLGAGGMGEVYRATDLRLRRDVAIKILPEAFAADADRLARFEREARVLASLNHPHIGGIHGIEEDGDIRALVLELVEGLTLAERLVSGPLPVQEALTYSRQIADALEASHEKGICHRDLKPANIKITPDGKAKVIDFGLARADDVAVGRDVSHSPTITAIATGTNVILGTAAYMSPEQARGKVVDRRADVWAFGCVIYVQPFPPSGGKWQVTSGGGHSARWRGDGHELFYLTPTGDMRAVAIAGTQPFAAGPPHTLFHVDGIRPGGPGNTAYEVARDGQRFLLNLIKGPPPSPSISVILNWPAATPP